MNIPSLPTLPLILDFSRLTPHQARYWLSVSRRAKVNVIDPFRSHLSVLRSRFPAGTTVYRASTGGKWGKSSQVVTL